jgi:hypothetical protein
MPGAVSAVAQFQGKTRALHPPPSPIHKARVAVRRQIMQPIVAVVADVRDFDNYRWHATPQFYLEAAMAVAGVLPLIVPAFGERDRLRANCSTGSTGCCCRARNPTCIRATMARRRRPTRTLRRGARRNGAAADPRRHREAGVPLFAICRGLQELNVALGGSIAHEIHHARGHRRSPRAGERRPGRALPPDAWDRREAGKLPGGDRRRRPRRGQLAAPPGDRHAGAAPAGRGDRR